MQIRQRLRINSAIMILSIVALIGGLAISTLRINSAMVRIQLADEFTSVQYERLALRTDYMRSGTERAREQTIAKNQQVKQLLKTISARFTAPGEQELIAQLMHNQETVGILFRAILANRHEAASSSRNAALAAEAEDRLVSQLNMRVYEAAILGSKLQEISTKGLVSALNTAGILGTILLLLVSAVILVNSTTMSRAITRRIGRLREGAALIGEGNLSHRIRMEGDDEFAELSAAFDTMALKLGASNEAILKEMDERKRTQTELHASEARLRTAINGMMDEVWFTDRNGNILLVNDAVIRNLGLESQEKFFANVDTALAGLEIFEPDGTPRAPEKAFLPLALNGVISQNAGEWIKNVTTGEMRYREVSSAPIRDENGDIIGAVAVVRDVTERKRAEEVLRESEARFALLSQTAGTLLFTDDPQSLVEDLCRKVMRHLDCDVFFNFMVDEKAGRLRLNACAGIPEEDARKIEWLDYGIAVCGCVARDRQRMIAEDICQTPDVRTELVKTYGVQAYCCHPLMVGERLIGTLSFGATRRARFSAEDVDLMQAVSHQVSVAMERIDRENALKESEERYRSFVQASSQVVWMTNASGEVVMDLPAWQAYTGQSAEEAQGFGWMNAILPEDRQRVAEAWRQASDAHTIYEVEYLLRRHDGIWRNILARGVPVFALDGSVREYVGTCIDVTESKQAEQALVRSDARWNAAIESFATGAIIATEDEHSIYWNPAARQMHGFSGDDEFIEHLEQLSVTFQLWTLDGSRLLDVDEWPIRRIKRGEAVRNLELRMRRQDQGWEKVFSYSGTMVETNAGERLIFLTCQDLTELREAEETLRRRTEELETLMDVAPVAIWVAKDPQCREIVGNRMANTFYQTGEGENVSANASPVRRFFKDGKELQPEELPMQQAALTNADVRNANLDVLLSSGDWLSILGSASPLRDNTGHVRGCVGGFVDVTDLKQAQQELKQLNTTLENRIRERTSELEAANRELESFSYSVSHDLRAPLRTIDGFTQILIEKYQQGLDEKGQDYMRRVRNATVRMETLIENLLRLSRLGQRNMAYETVDLSEMAGSVMQDLQDREPERKMKVVIQPRLITHGDKELLRIALENLLGNAQKFTRDRNDARIEFGATEANGVKVFFIRDNGAGFDPDYSNKLFRPFQRLHTEKEFSGTGIGLAIVQRIVNRHGGRIWADSQIGHGATFYFTLPDEEPN